jgi:RNA polymerase I-specific transcription initiation factor RRN3
MGASASSSLLSWLSATTHVVSSLDRRHSALVDAILSLPWTSLGGESFARAWIRFVCALVSARAEWTGDVCKRAVKGLGFRE